MRAVNLVPPDQRRAVRGEGRARAGLGTQIFVAVLGLAVIAVTALVLISNQINDEREELAELTNKQAAATAAGNALRPYGDFVQIAHAREQTIAQIAASRFNWERVIRQLSRVVPPRTYITEFDGTVSPGAGGDSGGGSGGIREGITGPAVEIKGCAPSQSDAARMMVRLRSIDGVSTVVMPRSGLGQQEGAAGQTPQATPAAAAAGGEDQCPKYAFEMTVGFKAGLAAALGQPATGTPQTQAAATGTTGAQGATGGQGATGAAGAAGGGTPSP